MARTGKTVTESRPTTIVAGYDDLFADIAEVIEQARRSAVRAVNSVMMTTYWLVGRRIVEQEQGGKARAGYGEALVERLAADLTTRFGRGFSQRNLEQMRAFHLAWPIPQTPSAKSTPIAQILSAQSVDALKARFPLPWSHYVRLLAVKNEHGRAFYADEALRGGWTVRQLDRQIQSQFYERTALSRNKAAVLRKGALSKPEDTVTPEQEIKEPYLLEFLDLKG